VKPTRWHLTLEFLGECGPHEVDRQLGRWERRAARSHPLTLQLSGAGTFPAKAFLARVLWIGVAGDVDGLNALAGYGQEPHLTLARTRDRQDLTGLVDELGRYSGPEWTAEEVVVLESFLPGKGGSAGKSGKFGGKRSAHGGRSRKGGAAGRGPRYVPLASFPLGRR
jgi:2'-5' RNA ligase